MRTRMLQIQRPAVSILRRSCKLLPTCLFLVVSLALFKSMPAAVTASNWRPIAPNPSGEAKRAVDHARGPVEPILGFGDTSGRFESHSDAVEMQDLLEPNAAEPRALASADFDEDGVPDLVCGYAREGDGIVTLLRGSVDSLFPKSPTAELHKSESAFTDSAFLWSAGVFEVPVAADFVGAGDFDADGHWDVVVATRRGKALYFLPGDGQGNLLAGRKIELPGALTSLVVGEINRPDGLTDIIVGVAADDGPKALVFEGPEGALKAKPEVFPLPAEPTALALGQFDDDYQIDLAAAAGPTLVIVHGRDRKLTLDESGRAGAPSARLESRSFGFEIRSIAVGDFTGGNETSLALLGSNGTVSLVGAHANAKAQLATRKSTGSDVEVLGQWRGATQLMCSQGSSGPADDILVLTTESDELNSQRNGVLRITTSLASSGLRVSRSVDVVGETVAALPMRLNSDALSDLVVLTKGHQSPMIVMTPAAMTFTVNTIDDHDDGVCNGTDCTLREAINAANSNPGVDTIAFNIAGAGAHTITPTLALPTATDPVTIDGTTQPGFAGTPIIELNGTLAGSSNGLTITAGGSRVRGLVINRFQVSGIVLQVNGSNVIEGNFIGTDVTGSVDLGNILTGVQLSGPNNIVGGTAPGARNIIAGNNDSGVLITGGPASGNVVQGNFIGTNVNGTDALGNGFGVIVFGSGNNIGGAAPGARNIISGNATVGVDLSATEPGANIVQGNFIGTDVTGTAALANGAFGVQIATGSNNTVGGSSPAARNVISGNGFGGVGIFVGSSTANLIEGNFIGTDAIGTAAVANLGPGVFLGRAGSATGPTGNTIGGAVAGVGNVISGNDGSGVVVSDPGATRNLIQGNFIGALADGMTAMGNAQDGVVFVSGPAGNTVGGSAAGSGNTIAFNGGKGVNVSSGTGNAISRNAIFSNTGLGIDLGSDGVTPNDSGDADVGANNLQNFPVLTSVLTSAIGTSIHGSLNSSPNATFIVQFFANAACDPSGFGEGQTFIGSTTLTTNGVGDAVISITLPISISTSELVTATATDRSNNTSEFSRCAQVVIGTFDICLQDESNGNLLQINSITGEYQFLNCRKGITLTGTGKVSNDLFSCKMTLQDAGPIPKRPDRSVSVQVNRCTHTATASIQIFSTGSSFSITDRDITNNTCACSATSGEVIYGNFGPLMAFDANPLHGWTINGFNGPGIGQQAIAHQFTPAATRTFTGAQVALALFSGPGNVAVFLQADSNGLPGPVLEQINLTGLTVAPTIFAATSVLHPQLHGGTPYWLTM